MLDKCDFKNLLLVFNFEPGEAITVELAEREQEAEFLLLPTENEMFLKQSTKHISLWLCFYFLIILIQ